MSRLCFSLILGHFFWAIALQADTIYTKDGRKLQGKVQSDDGISVQFETDTDVMIIQHADIEKLLDDAEAAEYERRKAAGEPEQAPDNSKPTSTQEKPASQGRIVRDAKPPRRESPEPGKTGGRPAETARPGSAVGEGAYWKRSLLFPGLGQYESGATMRGSVYFGAAAFLIYNFFQSYTEFSRAQAAYSSPLIPALLASTQGPMVNAFYMKGQRDQLFAAETRRNFSLQLLALFWGWNVFDAAYLTGGSAAAAPARVFVALRPGQLKRTHAEGDGLRLGLELTF